MEELTPEQKLLQEAIQKKVEYLKFIRKHLRLAGIVVQIAGIVAHNTAVMLFGTVVFLWSYMASVGIMEDINVLIWDKSDDKKEEDGEEKPEE